MSTLSICDTLIPPWPWPWPWPWYRHRHWLRETARIPSDCNFYRRNSRDVTELRRLRNYGGYGTTALRNYGGYGTTALRRNVNVSRIPPIKVTIGRDSRCLSEPVPVLSRGVGDGCVYKIIFFMSKQI